MEVSQDKRCVLLVEDSDDDAFFFERSFELAKTGADFVRVIDGGEAVKYLERVSIDSPEQLPSHLVFLDLKLPVLSGFDVLRWIREHRLAVDVVVLSGSDLENDFRLARELGASDYIVKPISSAEIKRRFGQALKADER